MSDSAPAPRPEHDFAEDLPGYAEAGPQLRFAIEAGRLGIWSLDLTTKRLTTSTRFREVFGRDQSQPLTHEDVREAIHPDDRARVIAAAAECVATGSHLEHEYRVRRPDGAIAWVQARIRLERDAQGRPIYLAGIALDITERKRTDQRTAALAQLDDILRTVEHPAELAFAAAEILGRVLDVSRAGYGTVNLAAETITIDRDWNAPGIQTLAGTLRFRDYGSYIDDLKRGETAVVTDAYLDERTRSTAAALTAISAQAFINMPVTEQGGLVALLYLNHATAREWPADELAFVREVALRTRMAVERRRAEADLRALAASLEQQVKARTDELMQTEAALRQSQKMEAVGQLTGGLAHDFNNLLTGITGSLELLKTRISQGRLGDVDRYVTAAEGAARRAAALTHRLLAFSRRQTLSPKATNINHLVAGMEELVRRTMGPAVKVEFVGSAGLWNTLVDPSQLENALLNLCINARDAMPDGGQLTVETANKWIDKREAATRDLPPGQYVSLAVSDTGTGMTPQVAAKAFDPFFTTKPIGQGTGLGLSMIYGFTQQSGGQARIYSELGQGSMVCLYLPRHFGSEELAEEAHEPEHAARAKEGATVLVVDDEPTVRMLVADVLTELGYKTVEAPDGAAGLKLLESQARIDLLITDVGLPGGLNGRQVADAARGLRPHLKVLFITGYAENAVVDHGHLAPGMHVLTKPFTMDALGGRVKDLVG